MKVLVDLFCEFCIKTIVCLFAYTSKTKPVINTMRKKNTTHETIKKEKPISNNTKKLNNLLSNKKKTQISINYRTLI